MELAKIKFTIQGDLNTALKSPMSGLIVETLGRNGKLMVGRNRKMIAGAGRFWTTASQRRELRVLSSVDPRPSHPRSLEALVFDLFNPDLKAVPRPASAVRGDINADGVFTVGDLDFLKRYQAGINLQFKFKEFQLQEMDPDFDGDTDGVDVSFILGVLAKKKRFLVHAPTVEVKDCVLTAKTWFVDRESAALVSQKKNKVKVEIKTVANKDTATPLSVDGALAKTVDGIVLGLQGPDRGVFTGKIRITQPELFELSLLMYTFLADGSTTSASRRFPFYGSTYGEFGKTGFSFKAIAEHETKSDECPVKTALTTSPKQGHVDSSKTKTREKRARR